MNYFNEGCILLLNDFSDFCKQCDEDFDAAHIKTLIVPFLQSRQATPVAKDKTSSSDLSTGVKPKTVKPNTSLKTKPANKNTEISVDEFNKLSINEIKSSAWNSKILVATLKDLCAKLGLPVTKLTKTQIIDSLITYKTGQENTDGNEENTDGDEENTASLAEEESPQPSTQKPKRRVIASAILQPVVKITKKHNLNLVFCDNEDVILVLSDNNQLYGFIPKETYDEDEDDTPHVLKPTKNVIHMAKNMGIGYEVPETLE